MMSCRNNITCLCLRQELPTIAHHQLNTYFLVHLGRSLWFLEIKKISIFHFQTRELWRKVKLITFFIDWSQFCDQVFAFWVVKRTSVFLSLSTFFSRPPHLSLSFFLNLTFFSTLPSPDLHISLQINLIFTITWHLLHVTWAPAWVAHNRYVY